MAALPLVVFDVNETLLDLQTMEPIFERIFGERQAMRLWFANFIMYSAALTVAGCYVPFTEIGSAVMKMLADTKSIQITDADKKELTDKFSTMPPHREVPAALRKLRDAGFRLFTLTDNLPEVQTRQHEHGGIVDLFERRFSADGVKHHKPSRQAYAYVERELGVEPCQLCLIACHTWDTLGAVAAGWEAALIKRLGNDVLGVGPQPQIVGDDLSDVAGQLITRDRWRASILNLWAIGTADRRRRAPVGRRFLSQYRLYAEQRRDLERADAYLTQPAAQFGTATGPVATDMARVRQRKCDMVPTLGRRSHGYGTNRDAGCTATHGTARRGYRSLTIAEGLGRLLAPRGGSRIGWLSMN